MEKTIGLVIKCKDYSETSQLVWLYTKDFGKIKLIAKGSRKKSKIDLFNLCEIEFYKSRGELHTLGECYVSETFDRIRRDLHRLAVASYMAELVNVFTGLEDPSSEIYSLIVSVFKQLADGKDSKLIRRIFETKLMQYLGYSCEIDKVIVDYTGGKRLKSLDFLKEVEK